jgi:hypothetical protein
MYWLLLLFTKRKSEPKEYKLVKPQPEQPTSDGVALLKADCVPSFEESRGR